MKKTVIVVYQVDTEKLEEGMTINDVFKDTNELASAIGDGAVEMGSFSIDGEKDSNGQIIHLITNLNTVLPTSQPFPPFNIPGSKK